MSSTHAIKLCPRSPADPEPDLTSLIVAHRAMREDLHRLTALLGDAGTSDGPARPARARAVHRYAAALLIEIRHHHQSEDDIVWPVIAATAGQAIDLAPLADDHQVIGAVIARADGALTVFGSAPQLGLATLQARVRELSAALDEHIEDEERQTVPVMRRYVPAEAYRWCEKQIQKNASLSRLLFAVPWLARYARPEELKRLLAVGGWPVRLALAIARPRYSRLERQAFGASETPG